MKVVLDAGGRQIMRYFLILSIVFVCSCDDRSVQTNQNPQSKVKQDVASLEISPVVKLPQIDGVMLCAEQEKCFNKSFDMAELRYGTDIANPNVDLFNDYRMNLYADCESSLFKKYSITRKEGYEIYKKFGCSVLPMPEKYYSKY